MLHWGKSVNLLIRSQMEPRLWLHCGLYPLQLHVITVTKRNYFTFSLYFPRCSVSIFEHCATRDHHAHNHWNRPKQWHTKSLVTCENSKVVTLVGYVPVVEFIGESTYSIFTTSKHVTFAFELIHEALGRCVIYKNRYVFFERLQFLFYLQLSLRQLQTVQTHTQMPT